MQQPNHDKKVVLSKDFRFKLVLVGCFGVGKTSLMLQHFERYFTEDPKTTVGVDFRQRKFHLSNHSIILEVWDTAGEEKICEYCSGAHAVVAVYDITKRATFTRAIKYIEEITSQAMPPFVVGLVGNKADLRDDRQVQYEEALMHANNYNLIFMETSAKTPTNVDQLFEVISERLIQEAVKRKVELEKKKYLKLSATQSKKNQNKCCST